MSTKAPQRPILAPTETAPEGSTPPRRLAAKRAPVDHRSRYRRRAAASDLLVTLVWASGAAAAALFLSSGGSAQLGTPADLITSLGIVAGLVGTDFILVMLVLAARVPFIDRTIGHDRAMGLHRRLGKPALYLLLAHGALLVVGNAVNAGVNPISEVVAIFSMPDLPLAFLALGLMIVVVVTSLVAVRRRFSYEAWHLVHLLSYAAVLVAVPHQLSAGGVLTEGSVERVYWIALYVLAFGSIITFRIIEPTVSSLRHRLRVAGVEHLEPGVASIHLSGRRLRALDAAGGQFFVWRFWTRKTWWHSHPISLSTVPTDHSTRITVRALGDGSSDLFDLPRGTRVSIEGPYGLFTAASRTAPRLGIIAAGIGITPVRALLEHSELQPGEATVVLRASTLEETWLWDEVIALARSKGATVYSLIGHRDRHAPGWLPETDARRGVTLTSMLPELSDTDLYVCGPTAWLDLVERDARAAGIPPQQLHSERFDW
jgi:predicted ferric reductase